MHGSTHKKLLMENWRKIPVGTLLYKLVTSGLLAAGPSHCHSQDAGLYLLV